MNECFVVGDTLTDAYHKALKELDYFGEWVDCPDYNTKQLECSLTMIVQNPLAEPRISKLFFGGPEDLQQYIMEMLDGILDFEIERGNWKYTYHNRLVNWQDDNQYPWKTGLDQIKFVIDELTRNPDSRRAVIDIRDNNQDMYSNDPACLQHIQFFIRNNKLHMKVLFRSNDACKALFMNAFALIEIQKYISDKLQLEVGTYTHRANSMHCYLKDFELLQGYIRRIDSSETIEDICFSYEDDWKQLMDDAIPKINDKVRKLKEN